MVVYKNFYQTGGNSSLPQKCDIETSINRNLQKCLLMLYGQKTLLYGQNNLLVLVVVIGNLKTLACFANMSKCNYSFIESSTHRLAYFSLTTKFQRCYTDNRLKKKPFCPPFWLTNDNVKARIINCAISMQEPLFVYNAHGCGCVTSSISIYSKLLFVKNLRRKRKRFPTTQSNRP